MAGGTGFLVLLQLALFLGSQWIIVRFTHELGVPSILVQIAVGIGLGPNMLNIVPYATSCPTGHSFDSCLEYVPISGATLNASNSSGDRHLARSSSSSALTVATSVENRSACRVLPSSPGIWLADLCAFPPFLSLAGQLGVTLMIFESGMHMHYDEILHVWKDSMLVAAIGTCLPVLVGMGFFVLLGFSLYPEALAAGVIIAPTSVGIALKLLEDEKQAESHHGKTIVTAAFADDVLSLIFLVILVSLADTGKVDPLLIMFKICISVIFVGFGIVSSILFFGPHLPKFLKTMSEDPKKSIQKGDEIHLALMFVFLIVYGYLGDLVGSHLLGAFVAGITFAEVPRSTLIWKNQTKRMKKWLVGLFFSSTVAFSIDVSALISPSAIWKGLVMGAIPTVFTKVISGMHTGKIKWIVGWAMVARGEFAYLIAETARTTRVFGTDTTLLSDEGFAVMVWALLISTVCAPPCFNFVLKAFMKKRKHRRSFSIGGNRHRGEKKFIVRCAGHHHTGVLHEICNVMHAAGLDVVEANVETDGDIDMDTFVVSTRGETGDLSDEKIEEISHSIREAIDVGEDAHVVFEPYYEAKHTPRDYLEVKIFGDHHPDILTEVVDELAALGLDIHKAIVDEHDDGKGHHTDVDTFYCRQLDRSQRGDPFGQLRLYEIRHELTKVFLDHGLHAEIMLHVIAKGDIHMRLRPLQTNQFKDEDIVLISLTGIKTVTMQHDVVEVLHNLGLDVTRATMDKTRGSDNFFAKMYDKEKNPFSKDGKICRKFRQEIRQKLMALYEKNKAEGTVSVRALRTARGDGGKSPTSTSPGSPRSPRSPGSLTSPTSQESAGYSPSSRGSPHVIKLNSFSEMSTKSPVLKSIGYKSPKREPGTTSPAIIANTRRPGLNRPNRPPALSLTDSAYSAADAKNGSPLSPEPESPMSPNEILIDCGHVKLSPESKARIIRQHKLPEIDQKSNGSFNQKKRNKKRRGSVGDVTATGLTGAIQFAARNKEIETGGVVAPADASKPPNKRRNRRRSSVIGLVEVQSLFATATRALAREDSPKTPPAAKRSDAGTVHISPSREHTREGEGEASSSKLSSEQSPFNVLSSSPAQKHATQNSTTLAPKSPRTESSLGEEDFSI